MRLTKEQIESTGTRLGPNSKFYIYKEIIYEPVYYLYKKTGTYKPVTDEIRIEKILRMYEHKKNRYKTIRKTVKRIRKKIESNKIANRFEIMDI